MYAAHVRFSLSDGRLATVLPGGIIGRLTSAALRIDDPRVSEAHAMVSLRGDTLYLLSLRGHIEVEGQIRRDVLLTPGICLRLAPSVELKVQSVEVPDGVLAVVIEGRDEPRVLVGEVLSLLAGPHPTVVARFEEDAVLRLWTTGSGWRAQAVGERAVEVTPGLQLIAEGIQVRFITCTASDLRADRTREGLRPTLQIRTALEELRVTAPGRTAIIGGVPARMVRELADYHEPVPWEMVARALFGEEPDELQLRARWDRNLKTLRRKLEEAGLPSTIVRSDRHGNVTLERGATDQIEVI